MTEPRPTAEQRRALKILADVGQNGATEAIMMLVHDHRHGRQRADTTDSRPHAGGARQGGYPEMVERGGRYKASKAGRRGSPSHVPVSSRVNKTGTGDDDLTLTDEVAG
jgi:hypothetical protein